MAESKKDGCVWQIAFRDISEYLHNQNLQIFDEKGDVWVVTPSRVINKEARRLNKELGLDKINYYGEKMNRHKKIFKY